MISSRPFLCALKISGSFSGSSLFTLDRLNFKLSGLSSIVGRLLIVAENTILQLFYSVLVLDMVRLVPEAL
jgi:hypothetical protein